MGPSLLSKHVHVLNQLESCSNISPHLMDLLTACNMLRSQLHQQKRFSDPMPWIGCYIAFASLVCVLAMVADLLHGLRNRKLWFPCKYFTLNAASFSVIAAAMKLPVDLGSPMQGSVDQSTKLGSMAFMCTMMANLLPSLATMDSKQLLTNIIALNVLVITLVVNVCIQINTGVISYTFSWGTGGTYFDFQTLHIKSITIIYVVMLLMLLIIHTCSSLAILKSKQILESKYQAGRETDQDLQQPGRLTVEKLKHCVSNYWIMAGTGSPQFMTACSATTSASGVICAISTAIHIFIVVLTVGSLENFESDYKGSMLVILTIQFVGVLLGSVAPLSRCFASLSFKLSIKWIWNHIKVFKVENHWTQMLSDWKRSSITFSFKSRKRKIVVQKLKILILNFCIGIQKTVVVACKMIGLIPIFFVICVLYCFHCWKWLKAMLVA